MSGDASTELATIRIALERAENSRDADAAADLLADDVVLMVPDFPVQEGKEQAVGLLTDVMAWLGEHFERHVTYVSSEAMVLGELALDRGTFVFQIVPREGGAKTETTGKYLWLLKRSDGQAWKVWRLIITRDDSETVIAPT
jgi:ketosteroid isomerase-like protein